MIVKVHNVKNNHDQVGRDINWPDAVMLPWQGDSIAPFAGSDEYVVVERQYCIDHSDEIGVLLYVVPSEK